MKRRKEAKEAREVLVPQPRRPRPLAPLPEPEKEKKAPRKVRRQPLKLHPRLPRLRSRLAALLPQVLKLEAQLPHHPCLRSRSPHPPLPLQVPLDKILAHRQLPAPPKLPER